MRVDGQARRTVWPTAARDALQVIDQRQLPHALRIERLDSVDAVFVAIRDMWVRGAPLIGATAAYGLALQAGADARDVALQSSADRLAAARPTATAGPFSAGTVPGMEWGGIRERLPGLSATAGSASAADGECAGGRWQPRRQRGRQRGLRRSAD